MTITFQGGRLPFDPAKPKLMLAPRISKLAAAAEHVDNMSGVDVWPMYGNDTCGDCTIATKGHAIQLASRYGAGTEITLSSVVILEDYIRQSGYDPTTGRNDTGLVVQNVLNDWRKVGTDGHKALAFAFIQPTDRDTIEQAIELFGWVYLGIDFPKFAMDQFNAGEPWDVSNRNTEIEGGHAIPSAYYDISDNKFKVVTWGASQEMTEAFWERYVEESWAVILPEWLNANGTSPTGLDLYGLGADLAQLTGGDNPFPEPEPEPGPSPAPPPPTPTPDPTPTPEPSADDELAKVLQAWIDQHPWFYRKVQRAAVKWLDARS
jgi:hypothetical protein